MELLRGPTIISSEDDHSVDVNGLGEVHLKPGQLSNGANTVPEITVTRLVQDPVEGFNGSVACRPNTVCCHKSLGFGLKNPLFCKVNIEF